VEALSYYYQAVNYDPSLSEAASRLNVLSANISSGNMGADVRNDIQWRKDWIARLEEWERYFANYIKEPAPYTLVYSTDLKQGKIDYEKETTEMGFTIYLIKSPSWFQIPEAVVNQVRTGIMATGRTQDWGLNWPAKSIAATMPFISKEDKFTVAVELLNDQRKVIGRQNVTLPYGWKTGLNGALAITPVADSSMEVTFTAVKADDITDKLNINIAGINGENVQVASRNRRISIMPADEYRKNGNYLIGFTGPAGGIVFYDKGSQSSGWRYLEAAPSTSERRLAWNDAINYCETLNTGGYNDWHLPDRGQLSLMYQNLKTKDLGGFGNYWYWSSSVDYGNNAWSQRFSDGYQGNY
jgi:hypothetical protein